MPPLAFTRSGAGAPLVLLHALGLSSRAWDPALPALAARFDVIAVDLPGFGDSAPLYGQAEVPPAMLAAERRGPARRPRRHRPARGRELPRRLGRAGTGRPPPGRVAHPALPGGPVAPEHPAVRRGQPAGLPLARPARDRTAVPPGELPAGPGPGPRPDPRPAYADDGRVRPRRGRVPGPLSRLRGGPGGHGPPPLPSHDAHHRPGHRGLRLT